MVDRERAESVRSPQGHGGQAEGRIHQRGWYRALQQFRQGNPRPSEFRDNLDRVARQ